MFTESLSTVFILFSSEARKCDFFCSPQCLLSPWGFWYANYMIAEDPSIIRTSLTMTVSIDGGLLPPVNTDLEILDIWPSGDGSDPQLVCTKLTASDRMHRMASDHMHRFGNSRDCMLPRRRVWTIGQKRGEPHNLGIEVICYYI